ncbi:insulin-like growth factor-binding protein complex acid labile subunit [Branchiostoma floridae]|uniref:Insulin-like growth factor-binding protein complex acid labile subunit n=1 Tax=Branchiostoma floridae TaxID=7739 RepID=A0A9J7LWE8_BRAFL|nr:insulin-like growth factor-binding protein complex acid labile subunit [Branchiostoma floridae]
MQGPSVFTKFFKAVRRICALLLMTHLVIPVQGEPVVACGSAGESLACTCRFRYVSCRLGDLTEVPTGMRDDTITLELWGNKITSIPKTAFVNLTRLYSIDLSRNKISSVEVGAFDWQADSLYQLSLNNNELETLSVGVFRNLSKFSFLDLDDNSISSLSVGLFRGLPKLVSISLNGNRISSLPVGIFADLPLSELKLARNKIKNIDNILPALPSELSSLDLKGNGLGNLRAAVFSELPKLESLKLEANEMDSLPKNLFLGLDKLSVLRLDHNMFVELNRSSFGSHPLLKRLSFANNSINVSKKLWEIGVDCTCEWKPVYDCPEFSWFDSIVTCLHQVVLVKIERAKKFKTNKSIGGHN